jgi:hypothetical protein
VLVVVGDIAENPSFLRSKPTFEVGWVLYLTMVVKLGWANVTILTLYESLLYHCFISLVSTNIGLQWARIILFV